MKYLTLTAIALFTLLAQGCAVEADLPVTEAPPSTEVPESPLDDAPVQSPEEVEEGADGQADHDDFEIEHPIARGPEPEDGDEDPGDDINGYGVDGDEGDDSGEDSGEDNLPGVSGGEDDEEDGIDFEVRGQCEPGQDECDLGFNCVETCEPSFCDEEGRCTQDCRIVYACIGNDPIPM